MEDKNKYSNKKKSLNNIPIRKEKRGKTLEGYQMDTDIKNFFKLKRLSTKSDNKIMNYSDTLNKLLGQIKSMPKKISSKNNSINESYNNSNSSEIDDDNKDSEEEKGKINTSPKKNQKLNRNMTFDSKKQNINTKKINSKLKIHNVNDKTSLMKLDKSPTIKFTGLIKKNDSIIQKFHRYFFQDGEIDKNNTIIKYNINKIIIEDINPEKNSNNENNHKNLENESDIFDIKNQVIKLTKKFDEGFTKEKKQLLIAASKDLYNFSKKYKFAYVMKLTLEWLEYLEDKTTENNGLKNFGYYNQIIEIMGKMLKEIKKKVDLMILYRERNYKNTKSNEKESKSKINNKLSIGSRKKTINKEDLLKSKVIVPIKLDIDIQNKLNINEIEDIIKNLEKGDFRNLENNNASISNKKKMLKSHFNNRNDNELETLTYPFKEDYYLCNIL